LGSPEGGLQRGNISMASCHVTSGWQCDPVVALEALASRPLVSVSSPERALGCTAARVHFGTAALPAEVRHPFGSAARRSADAALLERLLGALGSAVFCACFVGNSMGARDSVVELQFREDDASRAALHAFLDAGVWECTMAPGPDGVASLGVSPVAARLPSTVAAVTVYRLPPEFRRRGVVEELLRCAGYASVRVTAEHAGGLRLGSGRLHPTVGRADVVVAYVIPPAGDPCLANLPRAFRDRDQQVDVTVRAYDARTNTSAVQQLRPRAPAAHGAPAGPSPQQGAAGRPAGAALERQQRQEQRQERLEVSQAQRGREQAQQRERVAAPPPPRPPPRAAHSPPSAEDMDVDVPPGLSLPPAPRAPPGIPGAAPRRPAAGALRPGSQRQPPPAPEGMDMDPAAAPRQRQHRRQAPGAGQPPAPPRSAAPRAAHERVAPPAARPAGVEPELELELEGPRTRPDGEEPAGELPDCPLAEASMLWLEDQDEHPATTHQSRRSAVIAVIRSEHHGQVWARHADARAVPRALREPLLAAAAAAAAAVPPPRRSARLADAPGPAQPFWLPPAAAPEGPQPPAVAPRRRRRAQRAR